MRRTKRRFPAGLFEVQRLDCVLMDPERHEAEQSDTEDDAPRPRPLVITDPLDEVCKRLRNYFTGVRELSVSNIEDSETWWAWRVRMSRSCAVLGGFMALHREEGHIVGLSFAPPPMEL